MQKGPAWDLLEYVRTWFRTRVRMPCHYGRELVGKGQPDAGASAAFSSAGAAIAVVFAGERGLAFRDASSSGSSSNAWNSSISPRPLTYDVKDATESWAPDDSFVDDSRVYLFCQNDILAWYRREDEEAEDEEKRAIPSDPVNPWKITRSGV